MGTRLRDLFRPTANRRGTMLLVTAVLILAASTASALADSLTLSVTPAQPTDAGGIRITAQGTAAGDLLYVYYRQAGTGDCTADPTQPNAGAATSLNGASVGPNSFDELSDPMAFALGGYLVCGWLTDPSDATTVLAQATPFPFMVTPADTLSLAQPAAAIAGAPFDITASGTSYDSAAEVDATYKPAGGSCASTPSADTGTPTDLSGFPTGTGPYTVTPSARQTLDPGSYLFCAWLVDPLYATPLAATSEVVTVRPVQASLGLVAPSRVDGGEDFTVTVNANAPAGVPLIAVADLEPATAAGSCPANPSGDSNAAIRELDTQFTGTQEPAGTVTETNKQVSTPSFGTYLLCGWLVEGWADAQNPPTVAGPVSTKVTAVPPETFRGRSSQRLPITITLAPVERLILDVDYSDRLRCRGRATFTNGERWNGVYTNTLNPGTFGTLRISSAGKFHSNLNGNHNHTLKVAGTLSGNKMHGTLSEQGKSFAFTGNSRQRFACRTGTVRYTITTR